MIISLIGSADAGKTTIINALRENHPEIFGSKQVIYKGDGDIFLINIFKKIFGTQATRTYNDEKLFSTKNKSAIRNLTSSVSGILYFISIVLEYISDYVRYELIFRDKILLKDRYIYDFHVTFSVNLNIKNSFMFWIIEHFPKPSLIFFIYATEDNLFKRNKNNIPGAITSKKEFFEEVATEYNELVTRKKLKTVDNNGDLVVAVDKIAYTIDKYIKLSDISTIIISGPDGAGKSTLVNKLSNELQNIGIANYIVHFYHDTIAYKLLRKAGFYKEEASLELQYKKNFEKSKQREGKNKTFLWAALNVLDAYLQIFLARLLHPRKVLIFDRYLYDFLVSFEYYKVPKYKGLLKHLRNPKKAFIVISDPEVLFKRKPENLFSYFEFAHSKYLKIAKSFDMKVIDTTNTHETEAFNQLWNNL